MLCESSTIAELSKDKENAVFNYTDNMLEAILVQGDVFCASTKETFTGPCLLPNKRKQFKYVIVKRSIFYMLSTLSTLNLFTYITMRFSLY